jgi:hypothetical protein
MPPLPLFGLVKFLGLDYFANKVLLQNRTRSRQHLPQTSLIPLLLGLDYFANKVLPLLPALETMQFLGLEHFANKALLPLVTQAVRLQTTPPDQPGQLDSD